MNLKKKKLSVAVSSAVCLLAAGSATAEATDVMEEVVVKGIRGSLMQSMDVKRDANGIVDAISSEDIGKFPDTNLAESIQRITGVSINRVNGEGSEVTVRGFGGGFNLVTVNGRQMPSANVATITGNTNDTGARGDSRSFDFSNLASEGVSGIQVYKTGRAATPTGGVGATINIDTIKPLEAGQRVTVGVKAVDDQGGDDITSEVSGMGSWINDEGTIGVSVFGSYQDRDTSSRGINVEGFSFFNYTGTENHFAYRDPTTGQSVPTTIVNAPAAGQLYALPFNVGMGYSTTQRERVNGMVTFQFAPSDNLTITADAMYTSTELDDQSLTPGIWFSRTFQRVEFDGSTVVAFPTLLSEFISNDIGKDLFYANRDNATQDESTSVGINVDWQFSDNLSLTFDAYTADSESGGNLPGGLNSRRINVAGANAGWQVAKYRGGVPQVTVSIQDGMIGTANNNGIFDLPDLGSQASLNTDSGQEADIEAFSFSGKWNATDAIDVDFGVGYMSTEMNQYTNNTLDFLGGWGVGAPGDIPEGLVQQVCTACEFGDISLGRVPEAAELLEQVIPGESNTLLDLGVVSWVTDVTALQNAMSSVYAYDSQNPTPSGSDDNLIEEDMLSLYAQATLEGEVGGMPIQVVAGFRWEETEVTSTTQQTVVTELIWLSDNDFRSVLSPDLQAISEDFTYKNFLPSLDFSIDLTDDIKARASYSQTIARPAYNNLYLTTSVNNPNTPTALGGVATGTKGNVGLEPLESDNFDLSVEWYYDDSSYVSVGYYVKSVDNFVGTAQVAQPLFGIKDPTSGQPGTLSGNAVVALEAGGFPVTEPNIFTMSAILANPQDFPNGASDFDGSSAQEFAVLTAYDIPAQPGDPDMIFEVTQPINNQTAKIDGFEVAVQHFFGDTGFGIQANMTIVDGDIEFNDGEDPSVDQFALEGLSDSANVVLIYENEKVSARLAYNWRDEFLASTNQGNRMPAYVDEYQQLDANISYYVTDKLTISLDAINITEEGTTIFGRTKNILWFEGEADARYILSARYNF